MSDTHNPRTCQTCARAREILHMPLAPLRLRPIRYAPGVRERYIAEVMARPESPRAIDAREGRTYSALAGYESVITDFLASHTADDANTAVYAKILLERIRNSARNLLGEL